MDLQLPQEECDTLTQLLQEGSATSEERPNFNLDAKHPAYSLGKTTATSPCTTTANTEFNKYGTGSSGNSNESNNVNKIIYNISKDTDVLCLSLLPSASLPSIVVQPSQPLTARSSTTTTVEAASNKSNNNNNNNNAYTTSNNEESGHNSDREQVVDNGANRQVVAVASMRSVFFNQGNTLHNTFLIIYKLPIISFPLFF